MQNETENTFKPKIGRVGNRGKRSSRRFIDRVYAEMGKTSSKNRSGRKSSFTGRYIGRGFQVAKITRLSHYSGSELRRVIVKARFVKLAGTGFKNAKTHIRYLQRDGVTKDGDVGRLYNSELDDVDGKEFVTQAKEDRHQFRFIVSPEEGTEFEDLKIFTRELMEQMESDLRTKLDWVAIDHYNTDNPHTHIIIRGIDDTGKNLIIARDYMSSGIRERAEELATLELGPRYEMEIAIARKREVGANRFTHIDKQLIQASDEHCNLNMRGGAQGNETRFEQSLKIGRLGKLQDMGLANEYETGLWQLSKNIEPKLRHLGMRNDIIKTMHAVAKVRGHEPLEVDYGIFHAEDQLQRPVTGKLISKGFADEEEDKYYLMVEGTDGRTHYADVKQTDNIEDYRIGSIVEIAPQNSNLKKSDYAIAEIASKNDGLYSSEIHAIEDPASSSEFIQTHIRRLEGLRRQNIVQRYTDGSWEIPDDYLEAVSIHQKQQAQRSPLKITTKSQFSLEVQINSSGATWLDKNLVGAEKNSLSNVGFGGEVEVALKRRQAYLVTQGFAEDTEQGFAYQRGMLKKLERQEVSKVADKLSEKLGKQYIPTAKGDTINGTYTKPIELASGRYAIIEQSKEFNLVPWRSVLERSRNQLVTGKVGGSGISWQIGKKRGIGR